MDIVISNTSDNPLYQQIYEQICAQIIKGELESGFCLPPIRTVAKELRISVITVKRAWEELEREGFIYTMAGKGCFVAPMLASDKMRKDIAYCQSLGLSKADVLKLIDSQYDL